MNTIIKYLILLMISAGASEALAQLTPVPYGRIQNASTQFGGDGVQKGTLIFDYNSEKSWVAKSSLGSTATINSSLLNLIDLSEANDLSSIVTWTTVPDLYISQSSVVQYQSVIDHDQLLNFSQDEHFVQAAINITESQISDLTHYTTTDFNTDFGLKTTTDLTEGVNLYYTEARVSANSDVSANTSARHGAVTLGTTNGLTLSVQELSLGLSSISTTGALSSTDWNIFNNKQDLLVSGANIKTINGNSLLGSGDLSITTVVAWGEITGTITNQTDLISYLSSNYLSSEVNDLSSVVTWTTVPDLYISQSSVTQHQSALSITESQISDLTHYTTTDFNTDFATKNTDDLTEGTTNKYDQTVSFTGGTNVTIGGTYPSFTITDNTLSQTQINGLISDSIAAIDLLLQNIDYGAKTGSFTYDASLYSGGEYTLTTTNAVTVSIHNLNPSLGKRYQGTIMLDVGASNPSSVTVALYSDAGSTAITAGNTRGATSVTTAANEMSTITYTCSSDGTNTKVTLISSTGL